MFLTAITIGYAVPNENFDASVHSVFQSALNLRLQESHQLLTLVTANEADLPQGIRVDTPDGFTFETFRVGEQATCCDGLLALDILTIDLRCARRWKCDLSALEADPANPAVSAAWNFVWEALNQRQIKSNAEIIARNFTVSKFPDFDAKSGEDAKTGVFTLRHSVTEKAEIAMRELVEATRRHDVSRAESSVRSLIGLGSGLTPSGDDLLVGYLAGLWCAVWNQSERMKFVSDLGRAVIHQSRQTNDISRTYLYHAAQGQVSSLLTNLAEAVSRGENQDRLLELAEVAMRVGHTSGMDAVTGLLVGLAAWTSLGTFDFLVEGGIPPGQDFFSKPVFRSTCRKINAAMSRPMVDARKIP